MTSVWNTLGFFLGLLLFGYVLESVLTESILTNLVFLVPLFATVLVFSLVLPRIFPENRIVSDLKEGLGAFASFLNRLVIGIALVFVYLIGTGLIRLVAFVFRKKFIDFKFRKKSTWIAVSKKKYDFKELF